MFVYVCIHMCARVCIAYVCAHVCIVCRCVLCMHCVCACARACVWHVHVCAYMCTCVHVCVHVCTHSNKAAARGAGNKHVGVVGAGKSTWSCGPPGRGRGRRQGGFASSCPQLCRTWCWGSEVCYCVHSLCCLVLTGTWRLCAALGLHPHPLTHTPVHTWMQEKHRCWDLSGTTGLSRTAQAPHIGRPLYWQLLVP